MFCFVLGRPQQVGTQAKNPQSSETSDVAGNKADELLVEENQ
jgi:hypothetical protein